MVEALQKAMMKSKDELTRYEACKSLSLLGLLIVSRDKVDWLDRCFSQSSSSSSHTGLYVDGVLATYFHYLINGTVSLQKDILTSISKTWHLGAVCIRDDVFTEHEKMCEVAFL